MIKLAIYSDICWILSFSSTTLVIITVVSLFYRPFPTKKLLQNLPNRLNHLKKEHDQSYPKHFI